MANNTDQKLRYTIDADAGRASAVLKDLDGLFSRVGKSANGIGSVFGGNLASSAVSKLTGLLAEGGQAVLDYSSNLEQAKIGFETMTGSAEAASKHLKDLQDFAKTTPFQFNELVDASQKLQGVGFAAKDVIPMLTDVGNALSAAGRMADLPFAIKALGDIQAKGKLAGQEIIQLANAGIPIRAVLARDLGITTAKLQDMSEKGQISADMVFKALHHMSSEQFGGAMDKQSHTFAGAMSNITDALNITANEAFEPLYKEISKLTDRLAQSGDDFKKWGTTGKSAMQDIVDGFSAMNAPGGQSSFLKGMKMDLDAIDFYFRKLNPVTKAYSEWAGSLVQSGSMARHLDTGVDMGGTQYKLDPVTNTLQAVKEIAAAVKKVSPSLSKQLDSDAAEKATKSLQDAVSGLTSKLAFFGDTSEVAATKQKLINDGVYDFNTALGRNAISLAAQLDRLTATKKKLEDYNAGLKSSRDELTSMQTAATFEMKFPAASELDRFDQWVRAQASNFKELSAQIDSTRSTLATKSDIHFIQNGAVVATDVIKSLTDQVDQATDPALKLGAIGEAAKAVAKDLVELGKADIPINGFAAKVEGFVNTYTTLKTSLGPDGGDDAVKALGKVRQGFMEFLSGFQSMNPDTKFSTHVFGDVSELPQVVDGFLRLGNAIGNSKLRNGLEKLDELLAKLGLYSGGQAAKDAADMQKTLADPEITAAIEARAKALGMTAAQLKALISAGPEPQKANKRQGLDERKPWDGQSAMDQLGGLFGKGTQKEYDSFGNTAAVAGIDAMSQAFDGLGQALGSAAAAWVLYGSAGQSAQQMTAQILAGIAQQAVVKSVFELAEGFAMLGLAFMGHPGAGPSATQHFISSATYAGIAGIAAVAGRGVAGDSFKKQAGGTAGTGAGSGHYGSGSSADNLVPSSRSSSTAYYSGRDNATQNLADTVARLDAKIGSMSPGQVLTTGARSVRGFISEQAIDEIRADSGKANRLNRSIGNL